MKKSHLPFTKQLMLLMAALFLTGAAFSQNTLITDVSGSVTTESSAVLNVHSTSLGMLVPRLGSAPSTPANGLLYYSTVSNSFKYYNGSSWAELSSFWSRTGTDTWLSNLTDNVVIGTNANPFGYKFYVYEASPGGSQQSRFDGQVEFWNYTLPNNAAPSYLDADINDDGSGNGVLSVYSLGTAKVRLESSGPSYFMGGNVGIGTPVPQNLLHLSDMTATPNPQLRIENTSGGGVAAQSYVASAGSAYSEGLVIADGSYILNNTGTLAAGAQSDNTTMMKAYPSGIVDFDNQSRARAYLTEATVGIPWASWTIIPFDATTYDEHVEFGSPTAPTFTATEEGYYQVNSRTDFILEEQMETPTSQGYVSIAIYKNGSMYAQGNNLQGATIGQFGEGEALRNNLAPNVSDVVYLQAGETIQIFVWQSLWGSLLLRSGSTQTYVSIHKVS